MATPEYRVTYWGGPKEGKVVAYGGARWNMERTARQKAAELRRQGKAYVIIEVSDGTEEKKGRYWRQWRKLA